MRKLALRFRTALGRLLPTWMHTAMGGQFIIFQGTEEHRPKEEFTGDFEHYPTLLKYRNYSALTKIGWNARIAGNVRGHRTPGDPCAIMLDPKIDRLARDFRPRMKSIFQTGAVL